MIHKIINHLPAICILLGLAAVLSAVLVFLRYKRIHSPLRQKLPAGSDFFEGPHPVGTYLLFYSLTFILLCLLVFSPNFILGKALVWKTDAVPQYIPYLKYMGEYLRELFSGLFHGHFSLKMYDFQIGMGADVRTVVRMHPLEFLSVFVPSNYTEIFYNFLMFFRFYLAGLTFTAYCRYRSLSWQNSFISSFIYVFGGFTLMFGARHPIFSAPLILLPLLFLSLDRLLKKEVPLFFTLIVGLSLFTNYYFLYMCTICMGFYALIRFPQIYKEHRTAEFFRMMGRIIVFYLFGCALAAVSFLPGVSDLFSSNRLDSSGGYTLKSLLFYNLKRIPDLFVCSVTSLKTAGHTTYLGYAIPVLPALAALFMRKKKEYTGLKIALVLEYAALLMPLSGFIMSGFSAVNNRWTFVVAFTVAFATARVLSDFTALTRWQCMGMAAAVLLYGFAFFLSSSGNVEVLFTFVLLAAATALLLYFARSAKRNRRQVYPVFFLLTAFSLVLHGAYLYGNPVSPYTQEFVKNGVASKSISGSAFNRFSTSEDGEFYRVDSSLISATKENLPLSVGYNGVSLYNSVIGSPVVSYHRDLSNIGISAVHRIWSLDGRTGMEALANVKYYMIKTGQKTCIPYGFTKEPSLSDNEYQVYQNNFLLPLGYTYDSCISQSEYESLTALERQQIMLESVVLSDGTANDVFPASDRIGSPAGTDIQTVTPTAGNITLDDGVTFDNDTCHISQKNTGITLSYEKRAGYEAYLHLGGFERNVYLNTITVSTSDMTKSLVLRGKQQDYSLGRSDYVVNLGYSSSDSSDTVKISFPVENADYHLEQLEICYVPMEHYEEQIASLSAHGLQDVVLENNTVSGTARLDKNGFMVFSIPFSGGWKAYVDGEETALYQANTAYMGIALTEGDHEIVLKYTTPGLAAGALTSAISLLLFLGLILFRSMRVRRKKQQHL